MTISPLVLRLAAVLLAALLLSGCGYYGGYGYHLGYHGGHGGGHVGVSYSSYIPSDYYGRPYGYHGYSGHYGYRHGGYRHGHRHW